jgi:hypothetical protein
VDTLNPRMVSCKKRICQRRKNSSAPRS